MPPMRNIRLLVVLLSVLFSVVCGNANRAQEHRFVVFNGGKHGYIDKQGTLVIPIALRGTYVVGFKERRALFAEWVQPEPTRVPYEDENGKLHVFRQEKWGFIDERGVVAIPAQFAAADDFSEGLAAVAFDTDQTQYNCVDCDLHRSWGFIDKVGKLVLRAQYRSVSAFSQGLAAVENQEGKWGYIDTKGDTVIPFLFDSAHSFSEGFAAAAVGRKFGYINKTGAFVIHARYTLAGEFSEGLAAVRIGGKTAFMISGPAGGTWMFIGRDGKKRIALPRKTERVGRFVEGVAVVETMQQCGYVGAAGKMVVPLMYSWCEDFSEGLANVSRNGQWQYIDPNGHPVLTPPYFNVRPFKDGLAVVEVGPDGPQQKWGYIDKNGKEIWKPQPVL